MDDHHKRLKLQPSFWLSLLFVVVIAIGIVTAARWRWDTRLFPWVVGIPALMLALWQLVADFKGYNSEAQPEEEARSEVMDIPVDHDLSNNFVTQRTLRAMAWIAGFVLSIWLLGFLLAIPIFVFFYLKKEADAATATALTLSGSTLLLIWAVFDLLMNLTWPEAALFSGLR